MASKRPNIGIRKFRGRIMRPMQELDDRGQAAYGSVDIARDWPMSVSVISGREVEAARQRVPTADCRIECSGPLDVRAQDVIVLDDGRKFTIGYVEDKQQNGFELAIIATYEVR